MSIMNFDQVPPMPEYKGASTQVNDLFALCEDNRNDNNETHQLLTNYMSTATDQMSEMNNTIEMFKDDLTGFRMQLRIGGVGICLSVATSMAVLIGLI